MCIVGLFMYLSVHYITGSALIIMHDYDKSALVFVSKDNQLCVQ